MQGPLVLYLPCSNLAIAELTVYNSSSFWNASPQYSQSIGLSPLWSAWICLFKSCLIWKPKQQCSQSIGLSPLWFVWICVFKSSLVWKHRVQYSQSGQGSFQIFSPGKFLHFLWPLQNTWTLLSWPLSLLLNEFSGEKYLKNAYAMIGYRTPSNKNVKKHVENAHTEEKFQNTFVVPNF